MAVRWYLRHPLSATSVMELLAERGIDVSNRTVLRWVQAFGPQLALKLASIVDHLAAGGMRTRCSSSAARTSGTCSWRAPTAGQRHGRAFAHDFEPRLSSGVAPADEPVIRRRRQHWPKSPYRWPRSPPATPAQRPLPRRIAGNQSSTADQLHSTHGSAMATTSTLLFRVIFASPADQSRKT